MLALPLEMERRTKYRICNQNGSGCGMCVKSCPWNKPAGLTHDLRRTFATVATILGAPERVVMEAGRWKKTDMVKRYTQTIRQAEIL